MSEIKPCPFCGGEAHMIKSCKVKRLNETVMMTDLVMCSTCGASIYARKGEYGAEKWNRRVNDDATTDGAEEVYCPMASRACFANGKAVAWCLTCPYISKEDRELIKKAVKGSQPKTGHWTAEPSDKILGQLNWRCSECGEGYALDIGECPSDIGMNFCTNCGADMRGDR